MQGKCLYFKMSMVSIKYANTQLRHVGCSIRIYIMFKNIFSFSCKSYFHNVVSTQFPGSNLFKRLTYKAFFLPTLLYTVFLSWCIFLFVELFVGIFFKPKLQQNKQKEMRH